MGRARFVLFWVVQSYLLTTSRGLLSSPKHPVSAANSHPRRNRVVSLASSSAQENGKNDPSGTPGQDTSTFNSSNTNDQTETDGGISGSDQPTHLKSDDSVSDESANQPEMQSTKESPEEETIKTLYDILGANSNDSRDVIKRKYILLAKKSHPDSQAPDEARSGLDFNEIAGAWEILGDRKERQRYDR